MRRSVAILSTMVCVLGGVGATLKAAGPTTGSAPTTAPAKSTLEQLVKIRTTAILDHLQQDGDFEVAAKQATALFEQVVVLGSDKNLDAFREASYAWRLTGQLEAAPKTKRLELLKFLRANEGLGHALVFLVQPGNNCEDIYALLDRLRVERGDQLEKYAALTTAICVVHDTPLTRDINENTAKAPDPLEIFDYYVKNESAMFFGIRGVPPELLVYVVDTTASIEDMKWALARYAKDDMVGRHFFDIKYDYEHFHKDTPKKVTEAGYTLPHILQYGGVCADQAYFAMELGKSIGVPTAYARGASAEAGHAWVGFLQASGGKGWWNFDVGRYEEYRGVKGSVIDPQSKRSIPDSYVSLLAELIGTKPVDRQNCVALTDAAELVGAVGANEAVAPEALNVEITNGRAKPRKTDVDGELELLESALTLNGGYPRAWFVVRGLAKEGKLTLAQKKRWSDVLLRLCGTKYPDFAMAVLAPMIQTVDDTTEQNALWNAAFNLFQKRLDLSAEIRMNQARMWEANGDNTKAGKCYMDVIERYANAGPFVIKALAGAEKLLADKPDKVVTLYDQTWKRIQHPEDMAGPFMEQSNWYRVGKILEEKLRGTGDAKKADAVEAQLKNASTTK